MSRANPISFWHATELKTFHVIRQWTAAGMIAEYEIAPFGADTALIVIVDGSVDCARRFAHLVLDVARLIIHDGFP